LDLDLDHEDRKLVQDRIQEFLIGYAYKLKETGNKSKAREVYLEALSHKTNWAGIKGFVGSFF